MLLVFIISLEFAHLNDKTDGINQGLKKKKKNSRDLDYLVFLVDHWKKFPLIFDIMQPMETLSRLLPVPCCLTFVELVAGRGFVGVTWRFYAPENPYRTGLSIALRVHLLDRRWCFQRLKDSSSLQM